MANKAGVCYRALWPGNLTDMIGDQRESSVRIWDSPFSLKTDLVPGIRSKTEFATRQTADGHNRTRILETFPGGRQTGMVLEVRVRDHMVFERRK